MGWNGSGITTSPKSSSSKSSTTKGRRIGKSLAAKITITVVIAGVLSLVFWTMLRMSQDSAEPAREPKATKTTRIKQSEATKPVRPKPQQAQEAKSKKDVPFWERDNTNGFNEAMIRKWKFMRRPKPSYTNDMAKNMPKLKCEIFDSRVENEIAVLMTLKPGASMIGMPKYGEDYEREFKESCQRPIVIEEDDDEYTRQLKKDMIQVKIDLHNRMLKGEKIGDIIREARREAQRLSQIKDDVISVMRENINGNTDESDVDLYYEAANKLLEQHGIAPVKPLSISKYLLKRRVKGNDK